MRKKKIKSSRTLKAPAKPGIIASAELNGLIDEMTEEYTQRIFELGSAKADQLQGLLDSLEAKYRTLFEQRSEGTARQLVASAGQAAIVQSDGILRTLAKDFSLPMERLKTGEMGNIFSALTKESAELFKTIPDVYHKQVQQAVMRSITDDKGLQDLVPFFEEFSDGSKNYAKLRALDQTRKAFNGISRTKLQGSGFKKFMWVHSGGGKHPRVLHQELNKKVFEFDNPPFIGVMYGQDIYGFPGDLPNCRCNMKIVVNVA